MFNKNKSTYVTNNNVCLCMYFIDMSKVNGKISGPLFLEIFGTLWESENPDVVEGLYLPDAYTILT